LSFEKENWRRVKNERNWEVRHVLSTVYTWGTKDNKEKKIEMRK